VGEDGGRPAGGMPPKSLIYKEFLVELE
jgi:hypothetical protein